MLKKIQLPLISSTRKCFTEWKACFLFSYFVTLVAKESLYGNQFFADTSSICYKWILIKMSVLRNPGCLFSHFCLSESLIFYFARYPRTGLVNFLKLLKINEVLVIYICVFAFLTNDQNKYCLKNGQGQPEFNSKATAIWKDSNILKQFSGLWKT